MTTARKRTTSSTARKRTTSSTARAKAAQDRAKALNDNADLRAALDLERKGYVERGDDDRVEQIDAYIAKLDNAKAPADQAPRVPGADVIGGATDVGDDGDGVDIRDTDIRDTGIPAPADTAPADTAPADTAPTQK